MAQLLFFTSDGILINNGAGSGIGFFGGGFGYSVPVGSYQDTSFVTDGNGVNQGPMLNNTKYMNSMSGIVNSASSGVILRGIPNRLATCNIRFNHGTAVKVQNPEIRIYDRSSINNNPSGVTCQIAELVHPGTTFTNNGSGDATWVQCFGSGSTIGLVASPGVSGLSPNGPSTTDMNHDWFIVMSASPDSLGSKTNFGLYMSLEYL